MVNTFPHIIEQSAERHPTKDAFRCGNAAVTYAALYERTAQLAAFFMENGVQKGDRVGVYLSRCLDTAIAVYGIMRAGAVYVPLDTTAPSYRTCFLIEDCGIEFIVSNKTQKRKLQEIVEQQPALKGIIGLSMDWQTPTIAWESIFSSNRPFQPPRILEMDAAYIIYTSGSTGTPKGIMHTHRSGLAYAKLAADLYGLNENDRIGNHAPLHFDISTLAFFSSPLVGATAVIVPEAHTKLPASLASLMEKEQLTVWYSVPLALVQILQRGAIEKKDLSCLRWVLFGGEPFPLKHLRALMEHWPQATFSNVYGPAEVNQCTYYNFKTLGESEESVPLGQVWENTEALIVDEENNAIEDNSIGELLIRSATRMAGYWKQPKLTGKSLFKRPTGAGTTEVFYRTGDLVKRRKDGNLMFIGRKDRQVKVRGYRVELDEVEAMLLSHSSVKEAAVFLVKAEKGKTIGGAVILNKNCKEGVEKVRNFLFKHLPEYAVPKGISILQDFPRTSTGKTDRKALASRTKTDPFF